MNGISSQHLFNYMETLQLCFFSLTLRYSTSVFFNLPSITGVRMFISNYFITFNTCHYTVLFSPGVDILSNLNYFPVPRVGNLTQKNAKKFKCRSFAAPPPPPLRLNIDTCIISWLNHFRLKPHWQTNERKSSSIIFLFILFINVNKITFLIFN